MYTAKNHTEGPDKLVIGGELAIDGKLKIGDTQLKQALYQGDSDASTVGNLKTDFNNLLAKLRASGIMFATAPVVTISVQPEDIEVIIGHVTEKLTVAGASSDGRAVTYQWYSNSTKTTAGGSAVQDATTAEFAIPTDISDTTYYYCVVSAADAVDVASEIATVTASAAIAITGQPEDIEVTQGAITESLTVEATLAVEGTLTYQWYSNATDSNEGGTIIAEATSAAFAIPTTLTAAGGPAYYYYCVVSAGEETPVASSAATVTVVTE